VSELRNDQADSADTDSQLLPALAGLVVGMSRLLAGLAGLPPFRNAHFSVADWVALSILSRGRPMNNRQLANNLGVTRQRANQIKTSLEQAKLVSVAQSIEDARQNVLTVTSRGHSQLKAINAELEIALSSPLKGKERALRKANSGIRVLLRSLRSHAEAGKSGRARRKDARRRATKMSDAAT